MTDERNLEEGNEWEEINMYRKWEREKSGIKEEIEKEIKKTEGT